MTALLVTLAGAAGVLSRYGLGLAVPGPWTIVAVNVAGSFALGLLVGGEWGSAQTRTALGAGFLGGFTTFSTFSVQAVQDVDAGDPARAFAYVLLSVVAGVMAAAAGFAVARA
jgi:fluoride exporter